MTLLAFPTAAAKWAKLGADHVSISAAKGINVHQKFQAFSFNEGKKVYAIRQRFDGLVTERALQGIVLTHPSERRRSFIDSISLQVPLPTVDVIFQQMIALEKKWEARDEKEHTEANSRS